MRIDKDLLALSDHGQLKLLALFPLWLDPKDERYFFFSLDLLLFNHFLYGFIFK